MKKIFLSIILSLIMISSFVGFAEAKIYSVRGYVKPSTGRYVMPHYKTTPNSTKFDNFSTKGNYNPFTGKKGKVSPLKYNFKF